MNLLLIFLLQKVPTLLAAYLFPRFLRPTVDRLIASLSLTDPQIFGQDLVIAFQADGPVPGSPEAALQGIVMAVLEHYAIALEDQQVAPFMVAIGGEIVRAYAPAPS